MTFEEAGIEPLGKTEGTLVRSLQRDSLLMERVERLMTIPAVGPIMALTWALTNADSLRNFRRELFMLLQASQWNHCGMRAF